MPGGFDRFRLERTAAFRADGRIAGIGSDYRPLVGQTTGSVTDTSILRCHEDSRKRFRIDAGSGGRSWQ